MTTQLVKIPTGGKFKKAMYVLVVALIACVVIAFLIGRNYPKTEMIDKIVQDRIGSIEATKDAKLKESDKKILVLSQELKQSKLKYQRLRNQIEAVAKKESEIVPPKTNDEIYQRLNNLGYRTK